MISADRNIMFQVAVISKSYGTNGECLFSFLNAGPEDIKVTEPVFIYFDGLPVPFFIEHCERKGNKRCLVKLTDVDSFDSAEEIVGKEVYILTSDEETEYDEDFIDSLFDETGFFNENGLKFLIGWTVYDLEDSPEDSPEDSLDNSLDNTTENATEIAHNNEIDSEKIKEVGTIVDYENIASNPCLYVNLYSNEDTATTQVLTQGNETDTTNPAKADTTTIMIPLHEDLIVSINLEAKELILNLPTGLI